LKCFSLFSGIGGFDLALKNTGHTIVGACEIDEWARQIYQRHFPNIQVHQDARKIKPEELPDFELLVAGFPCQPFSVAGKRLGFEESRGTLFFEIARIARQKRPRLLLLENVKGLLNHDGGKTFANILATMDELGYDAEWQVLNSKYFVPQNRERVFIICYLRGTPRPKVFPITESSEQHDRTHPKTQGKGTGLQSQIVGAIDSHYYKAGSGSRTLITSELELKQLGNIAETKHNSIWGRVYDPENIAVTINAEGGGLGAKTGLYVVPVITPGRQNKKQNGRQFKEAGDPSFSLTTNDPHGIFDGKKIRRLTPLECERLQGFPDGWTKGISDTQRYRCCGNAVTVPVVQYIMERLT